MSEVLDCLVSFCVSVEDPLCIWNRRQATVRWIPVAISPTTSIPTTSETTTVIKDRHEKPKNNNDSGFLKTLVSQYCDIEHSIGILQLCNSRILSRNRYDRPQGLTLPSKPTYYGRNDRKIQKPYLFTPPPNIFHRVTNAVFSAFASHHK